MSEKRYPLQKETLYLDVLSIKNNFKSESTLLNIKTKSICVECRITIYGIYLHILHLNWYVNLWQHVSYIIFNYI